VKRLVEATMLLLIGCWCQVLKVVQYVKAAHLLCANGNDVVDFHALGAGRIEAKDGFAVSPFGGDLLKVRSAGVSAWAIAFAVLIVKIHHVAALAQIVCGPRFWLTRLAALDAGQRSEPLSVVDHRIAVAPQPDAVRSAHALRVDRLSAPPNGAGTSRGQLPLVGVTPEPAVPFHLARLTAESFASHWCWLTAHLAWRLTDASDGALVMQPAKPFAVVNRVAAWKRTRASSHSRSLFGPMNGTFAFDHNQHF
jgi:hypothetical protein